jgi:hypothetical protein
MNEYPFGQAIRLTAEFANDLGNPANPTTVVFEVGLVLVNPPPDPTATVAIFGIDSAVTNPVTGTFFYALLPTQSGNYIARVVGTGAVQAAQVRRFRVLPDPFA